MMAGRDYGSKYEVSMWHFGACMHYKSPTIASGALKIKDWSY